MDSSFRERGVYRFGSFCLDPARRLLLRDGVPVPLRQIPFDALLYLTVHHGRVVGRDELMRAVWAGRTVDDNNIGQTISAVRRALRDGGAGDPIVTLPGRGYQFGADVAFEPVQYDAPAMPPAAPPPRRRRTMWPALLIVVCLAVAGGALLRGLRPPFRPPPYSVAVLAFANLTGDPGQDYLADGLADDLIGRLGGVPAVHVVARASSFAFKGSHATAAGMARALGVGAVLEGSLSQTGGMRTIRVQLVDGQNGYVVWTRQFAAPVADAAILQAGIAEGLLQALHVPGAQADAAQAGLGTTRNEAALDAFLRGLHDYAGADAAGAERAVADFDQALSHDPGFALALVRRAAAIVLVVDNESSGDAAWLNRMSAQAMASVERAIAIAPGLGVAHSQLASMKLELNRDFAGALTEAEQARTLAPGDARVQIDVAYVLGALGRQAEAEAAARSAVAHDPLSAASWRQLALTLLYGRKFADAAASLAHARAVEPAETDYDRLLLSQIVLKLGHPEQALQLAGKMQGWTGTFIRALALHALGREGEAAQQFSALQTTLRDFGALRYADILAQSGRTAEALSWLRKAAAANDPNLFLIREDYLLDPLRDTQDFQAIERGLKFPD